MSWATVFWGHKVTAMPFPYLALCIYQEDGLYPVDKQGAKKRLRAGARGEAEFQGNRSGRITPRVRTKAERRRGGPRQLHNHWPRERRSAAQMGAEHPPPPHLQGAGLPAPAPGPASGSSSASPAKSSLASLSPASFSSPLAFWTRRSRPRGSWPAARFRAILPGQDSLRE